ncbi:hypothetical protein [Dyella sp. EPa41]|nr:hypothetical protein [Dyella sp. EPa41]
MKRSVCIAFFAWWRVDRSAMPNSPDDASLSIKVLLDIRQETSHEQ